MIEKQSFSYARSRILLDLLLMGVMLTLGIFMFYDDVINWWKLGYFVIAAIYLVYAAYKFFVNYVEFTGEEFVINNLNKKRIPLTDIRGMTYFAETYHIKTDSASFKIEKVIIDKKERDDFHKLFFDVLSSLKEKNKA